MFPKIISTVPRVRGCSETKQFYCSVKTLTNKSLVYETAIAAVSGRLESNCLVVLEIDLKMIISSCSPALERDEFLFKY